MTEPVIVSIANGTVGTIVRARKRLIVDVPNELHLKFKATCSAAGVSMSEVIERMATDFVNNPPKPGLGLPTRPALPEYYQNGLPTTPTEPTTPQDVTYPTRPLKSDSPPPLKAYPCGPIYRVRKGSPEAEYFHTNTVWVDQAGNEFDKDGWVLDKTQSGADRAFTDTANGRGMWELTIVRAIAEGWEPKTWFEHYDDLMQVLLSSAQDSDIRLLEMLARWKNKFSKVVYSD